MAEIIKGNLNQVLKELAIELAFTDSGINKEVCTMIKDAAKSTAKELKSKDVELIDEDIENVEVACYICTITEVLLNNLSVFVEKQNSVKH